MVTPDVNGPCGRFEREIDPRSPARISPVHFELRYDKTRRPPRGPLFSLLGAPGASAVLPYFCVFKTASRVCFAIRSMSSGVRS